MTQKSGLNFEMNIFLYFILKWGSFYGSTVYGFRCPPHQPIPLAVAPPPAAAWRVGPHLAPRQARLFLQAPKRAPLVPAAAATRQWLPHLGRNLLAFPGWLEPSPPSAGQRFPGVATGMAPARCHWSRLHHWRLASSRSTAPRAPKTRGRCQPHQGAAHRAVARRVREETEEAMEEVTGTTAPRRQQETKHRHPRSRSLTPWNVYNWLRRKQHKRNWRNEKPRTGGEDGHGEELWWWQAHPQMHNCALFCPNKSVHLKGVRQVLSKLNLFVNSHSVFPFLPSF